MGISWGRSGERERGNTAMRNWGNGRHRCNNGRNGCEEGWKCRRTGYRDQGRYLKDWNEKGAKAGGRTESMDWREWLGYDGNDAMETGRPVEEERQLDRQGGRWRIRQTDRQTDSQAGRQRNMRIQMYRIDRYTGRQTHRQRAIVIV